MNVRNMLLAGFLFVVPCSMFGEETTGTSSTNANPPTEVKQPVNPPVDVKEKAGFGAILLAPFVFLKDTGLGTIDFTASWTINPLLNKITDISCLSGLKAHVNTTGRIVVTAAFAAALYKAYQAWLEAQNDDADQEPLFYEENNN